ncbi:hypothetical protein FKM82_024585 [Ascaphus truei]
MHLSSCDTSSHGNFCLFLSPALAIFSPPSLYFSMAASLKRAHLAAWISFTAVTLLIALLLWTGPASPSRPSLPK